MENLTFLQNILVFIGLNSLALLSINFKKFGKSLAYGLSLLSSIVFLAMLFGKTSFTLSELFILDGNKILLLKVAGDKCL